MEACALAKLAGGHDARDPEQEPDKVANKKAGECGQRSDCEIPQVRSNGGEGVDGDPDEAYVQEEYRKQRKPGLGRFKHLERVKHLEPYSDTFSNPRPRR